MVLGSLEWIRRWIRAVYQCLSVWYFPHERYAKIQVYLPKFYGLISTRVFYFQHAVPVILYMAEGGLQTGCDGHGDSIELDVLGNEAGFPKHRIKLRRKGDQVVRPYSGDIWQSTKDCMKLNLRVGCIKVVTRWSLRHRCIIKVAYADREHKGPGFSYLPLY